MKFCDAHWDKLRAAVKERGMEHLVPTSGAEAAERMTLELDGTDPVASFDPLMACHWLIVNRALEYGGLYLMTLKPDGSDYCPVCEAMTHTATMREDGTPWTAADTEKHWIEGPADAVLDRAKELNLIGPKPRLQ